MDWKHAAKCRSQSHSGDGGPKERRCPCHLWGIRVLQYLWIGPIGVSRGSIIELISSSRCRGHCPTIENTIENTYLWNFVASFVLWMLCQLYQGVRLEYAMGLVPIVFKLYLLHHCRYCVCGWFTLGASGLLWHWLITHVQLEKRNLINKKALELLPLRSVPI